MGNAVFLAEVAPVELSVIPDRVYHNSIGWLWLVLIIIGVVVALLAFKKTTETEAPASKLTFSVIVLSVLAIGIGTWMLVSSAPWAKLTTNGYATNIAAIEKAYGVTNLKVTGGSGGDNIVNRITNGKDTRDGDNSKATWTTKNGVDFEGFVIANGDNTKKVMLLDFIDANDYFLKVIGK